MQLGLNHATFLAVDSCSPQGALASVSVWKRDAGGAVGTQRRGAVLNITHRHGLRTERSLPSKWALATADGHSQTLWKACKLPCPFATLVLCNSFSMRYWCLVTLHMGCIQVKYNIYDYCSWMVTLEIISEWNQTELLFTHYTDEPESTHFPPFLQWTWAQGLTPHWPTLRPKAGCPSAWNFPSLLEENCTSKMHPLKRTNTARHSFHFSERGLSEETHHP